MLALCHLSNMKINKFCGTNVEHKKPLTLLTLVWSSMVYTVKLAAKNLNCQKCDKRHNLNNEKIMQFCDEFN